MGAFDTYFENYQHENDQKEMEQERISERLEIVKKLKDYANEHYNNVENSYYKYSESTKTITIKCDECIYDISLLKNDEIVSKLHQPLE